MKCQKTRSVFNRTSLVFSGTLKPRLLTAAVQLENSAGLESYWCFQTNYEPQVKQSKAPSYFPKEQSKLNKQDYRQHNFSLPLHLHYIKRLFRKQASSSCCYSPSSTGTSALEILALLRSHLPSQKRKKKKSSRIHSIMSTAHLRRHFTFQRLSFSLLQLFFGQLLASLINHEELNLATAAKFATCETPF